MYAMNMGFYKTLKGKFLMNNPFSLTFGMKPKEYIERLDTFSSITAVISSEDPENRCFIITGARASGKTVFLTEVGDYYKNEKNWIVIDLNPERDMLESLASKIYDASNLKHLFLKGEFSFSFQGFTFSLRGETPISDVETLLNKMVEKLMKKGIRILVTIDEATNSSYMKTFAHTFQGFLRSKFDVFLLMSGLYQNVQDIQNQQTLTFLYRSKKIPLPSLSLVAIATSYENILNLDHLEAVKAAKMTNGYAFAYQALDHLLYESVARKVSVKLLQEYDLCLSQFVYEKIYGKLSPKAITFLNAITKWNTPVEIEKNLSISHSEYSVYRKTLIDRGILYASKRGRIDFALPRFANFLEKMKEFYD